MNRPPTERENDAAIVCKDRNPKTGEMCETCQMSRILVDQIFAHFNGTNGIEMAYALMGIAFMAIEWQAAERVNEHGVAVMPVHVTLDSVLDEFFAILAAVLKSKGVEADDV